MAAQATFSLKIGGAREILINAEEARDIVSRLEQDYAENTSVGRTLTKVDLSCRTYKEETIPIFADFFTPERVQHVVDLDMNNVIASLLEEEGLEVLRGLSGMFATAPLERLNLSDNALGNKGLLALNAVLQTTLQELLFRDNGIAAESMELLRDRFANSPHLRVVHFFNNMVGSEGSVFLAEIVGTCPSLKDFCYAGVRAGAPGTAAVVRAIAANEEIKLEKLDLDEGTLLSSDGNSSVDALITIIRRSPGLVSLNIADCGLDADSMNGVCQALLESECFLSDFNVSCNELGPDCCESLRQVLNANSYNLIEFKAELCEFTSVGVRTLLRAYNEDAALQRLWLSENQLAHIAAVALEGARPHLRNLTELKLNGNGFEGRDLTRLQNAYGTALVEIEDNESDEEYDEGLTDEEDDEVEEEIAAVNNAPEQDDGEEEDEVDALSQMLGRNAQIQHNY